MTPSLLFSHWQLSWTLELQGTACLALYLWAVRRMRGGWPVHRTLSFLCGLATILIALQSGIDSFDDRLLSVHMVQHMLLLIVAPPLLVAGRPALLALRALPAGRRPPLTRALTRARPLAGPVPGVSAFCAVVLLTHLPFFYGATLTNPALHAAEHGLYLAAGLMLWWPLLDGDPVPTRRLGGLGRFVCLLTAMAPMALVGAYLNRHPTLVYPAYGAAGHAPALADQQQAGAIMWVGGDMVMVAVGLWAALAALVAAERRQRAREIRAAASGGAAG
jgi:cytochrome c oxidase assembly factor CtaG